MHAHMQFINIIDFSKSINISRFRRLMTPLVSHATGSALKEHPDACEHVF